MREWWAEAKKAPVSWPEYWRRVLHHWRSFLVGVVLFGVGTAQVIFANLAFPWWLWVIGGAACVFVAQFLAFHDVRIERENALGELEGATKEPEHPISAAFSYDRENMLAIELTNNGATIKDARINVIVPHRSERQRLSRMAKYAPYDTGSLRVVDEELVPGVKSLVLREHGIEVLGYSVTELRFLSSHDRSDPIRFQIGADELSGWISWGPLVVPLPTEPFDKDAFPP